MLPTRLYRRWKHGNGKMQESTMSADGRIERARMLYENAVFGGNAGALAAAERELDAVEADLALARGRTCPCEIS